VTGSVLIGLPLVSLGDWLIGWFTVWVIDGSIGD
jgi:hypothetical protein